MDRATSSLAYPAYPNVIAQLLPDEAKIVGWLARSGTIYCYYIMAGEDKIRDDVWLVNEDAGCDRPQDVREQIGNLNRLGLTTFHGEANWGYAFPPMSCARRPHPVAIR